MILQPELAAIRNSEHIAIHRALLAVDAVHIGARIAAIAGPNEILVSRTVKDLVVGSGIQFDDRGEHALKGVPDEWRVYAAV